MNKLFEAVDTLKAFTEDETPKAYFIDLGSDYADEEDPAPVLGIYPDVKTARKAFRDFKRNGAELISKYNIEDPDDWAMTLWEGPADKVNGITELNSSSEIYDYCDVVTDCMLSELV